MGLPERLSQGGRVADTEKNAETVPGKMIEGETLVPSEPLLEPEPPLPPPPVHEPAPPPPETVRVKMGRPFDYWLLWLVALGSIALNVWLINTLLTIQRQVTDARLQMAQGLIEAANGVATLELGTVDYTIEVNEELPLDIAVPISDTLTVPISHTINVNSAAVVNLPLIGRQSIPFSVRVPVDLEVSIPISRTYTVSDTIPIDFDVPISISLDETPLGSLKGDIQSYLLELADELSQEPAP
jgi:hypothetical protein